MIEIVCVWFLMKKIAGIVEAKGHKSGIYMFLTAVFWFGGELIGLFVGALITRENNWILYLFALAGAAIGAGSSFWLAKSLVNLSEKKPPRAYRPKKLEDQTWIKPITICPKCKASVIPKPDGTCPSCQSKIA